MHSATRQATLLLFHSATEQLAFALCYPTTYLFKLRHLPTVTSTLCHPTTRHPQTLRFESYRDLVRLMARGLSEPQGLRLVEEESLERRAAQHAALQAATDAVYNNPRPGGAPAAGPGVTGPGGLPSGSGVYSSIGFSYDTGAAGGAGPVGMESSSSDSDSDDSDDSGSEGEGDEGGVAGPVSEAELAQEAEDDRVDEMAEGFGLEDFTYRLHKAQEREGEEEARLRNPPKCVGPVWLIIFWLQQWLCTFCYFSE